MAASPYDYPKNGISNAGAGKFPNPFFDIASEYIPTEIVNILEWSEYLYISMGTYRAAARRVVRYFLTEVTLDGESDSEREDFNDFLNDKLHLLGELAQIGDDFMTYGNVFISLYFPFIRFLKCPKCGVEYVDKVIVYKFTKKATFECTCKKCGYSGEFEVEDRRSPSKDGVKIIRWNPKHIKLRYHPVSGKTRYFWQIPSDFMKKLEDGVRFYVEDTPKAILECIGTPTKDSKVKLFEFAEESIYHLKESTLAGLPVVGWGIPPILPNFKLAYYIQVLRRADEAIALDYIIPFRVIFPEMGPSPNQDAMISMAMSSFKGKMAEMVKNRRNDPTSIQVAPFKIGYQMLGGEGKTLTPKDNIAYAVDELLNALGFPAELYKGSLSIQAAPVALRLFEKTWGTLVDGYNDLIAWLLQRISRHYMWGNISGSLRSVTLADDLERKALSLQAAAGMDISKATAYQPFGIDYLEEQRRVVEEQQSIQELQQASMEEQQAQQGLEGGAGGGEGAPAGPGGQAGATPGDVHEQAKQTAQTLLLQTPESLRRGELIKIKHSNPTLHALVIQEMDSMRQQMSSEGGAMMMEQAKSDMQGAGGGMQAQASAPDEELFSTFTLGYTIADQVLDYDKGDMMKLAMAVKHDEPLAKEAFHYIYAKQRGWT